MTIGGALSELSNLLKADDVPFYYKPSIKAVMDTIALSSSENQNKWIPVSERLPEEDTEIHVGDEVIWTEDNSESGVVTRIESSENAMWIVKPDGLQVCANKCRYWEKTGRHFPQIAEVLKKMKENECMEEIRAGDEIIYRRHYMVNLTK